MTYLIDSHALIWWWNEDDKLSRAARDAMADRSNALFVSAASAWEIATKVRAGRLPSMARHLASFDANVRADGFGHLVVRQDHGVHGGLLPGEHADPFDRLIAAQALIEGLVVITRDKQISRFGCRTLW
jgi:PIN domain nuclease of toxin-antitoxin system